MSNVLDRFAPAMFGSYQQQDVGEESVGTYIKVLYDSAVKDGEDVPQYSLAIATRGDIAEFGVGFDFIPLSGMVPNRAYTLRTEEKFSTECRSNDGIRPVMPGKTVNLPNGSIIEAPEACADCPLSKWSTRDDGKKQPPLCNNGFYMPVLVTAVYRIPPSLVTKTRVARQNFIESDDGFVREEITPMVAILSTNNKRYNTEMWTKGVSKYFGMKSQLTTKDFTTLAADGAFPEALTHLSHFPKNVFVVQHKDKLYRIAELMAQPELWKGMSAEEGVTAFEVVGIAPIQVFGYFVENEGDKKDSAGFPMRKPSELTLYDLDHLNLSIYGEKLDELEAAGGVQEFLGWGVQEQNNLLAAPSTPALSSGESSDDVYDQELDENDLA